jgi:predicted enzyme involved in methoxymalonyl-ACP biosynthesis
MVDENKIEIELLKKEVQDMKEIHLRLDTAIVKLTDLSNSVYRMLSVHEEKLARQEDDIVSNEKEIKEQILNLHSRINTSYKELRNMISKHQKEEEERFNRLEKEFSSRVGILEKWRWIIMGGSIVAGFILHKLITFQI